MIRFISGFTRKSIKSARQGVKELNDFSDHQYLLVNYVEDVISSKADEMIEKAEDVCSCPRCRLDIIALALNDLKPKYVVSPKGYAYARVKELEAQTGADGVIALTKAIKRVRENPRH